MATTKEEILNMIRDMPDNVTLDDVLYRLYVHSQIEAGIKELDDNKTIPHDEVKSRLERWLR